MAAGFAFLLTNAAPKAQAGLVAVRRASWLALVLLIGACASVPTPQTGPLAAPDAELQACQRWFADRDAAVARAGVRDAAAHPVPGFAHLRVDRFSASLAPQALGNADAWVAWLARLRALDAQARAFELSNLATTHEGEPDLTATRQRDEACAQRMNQAIANDEPARQLLAQRAQVPDDYSSLKRAAGLYALTRLPFFMGVQRWQDSAQAAFAAQATQAAQPPRWQRYAFAQARPSAAQIRQALAAAPPDALGVPQLSAEAQQLLLQAYAPSLEVETLGSYDRIGALRWAQGKTPEVDATQPLAYQRVAYTRFGGQVLAQLVYSFWFAERPKSGALDLLGGTLDAVVLRITLAPTGEPLLVDSIHACGCYHLFFPTAALQPAPGPQWEEWAFIPTTLPALGVGQRVQLRLASGSHYVVDIRPDEGTPGTPYTLQDDDSLRALPLPGGGTRSVFGANGIIEGTERGERFLFWPMGIESPGAMRQWGRHPTAFVGRRHFDDARLMEQRFRLR
jgi:hypothetical protein